MIFTLEIILDELADLVPVSNHKTNKNMVVQGMFYYSPGQAPTPKNCIYVCHADDLLTWDNKDTTSVFFLINSDFLAIKHVKNPCFIFQNAYTSTEIINRYMQLIAKYSYWDKEMHLSIINSASLEMMLDHASQIIEFPIQVYDPSFRVLATSTSHKVKLTDYQTSAELGYTPPALITKIQQKNLLPRIKESAQAILAPSISIPHHRAIYRAHKIDGQLLGYSCVFCGDNKITQGYLDKAELFFQNLDFYFKENQKHLVLSKYMYESFLITLMTSKQSISSRWIVDRAQVANLPLKSEFILIQFNFSEKEHFLQYLCRLIQKYLPEHSVFVYEDNLYLMITQNNSHKSLCENAKNILKYLHRMLPTYSFSSYISNTFYELTSIYEAVILCNKLLEMQLHFSLPNGTYAYEDHQPLLHCLQYGQDFDSKMLFMPEIYKISLYDEKYNTHYFHTLLAYFEHNCDLKETAKALDMHRNSIANRIEKIQQLFRINLSDFKICYKAYETLILMNHMSHFYNHT